MLDGLAAKLPYFTSLFLHDYNAACSAHEVHIDDEQLAWFEEQLQGAGDRPVAVFTHAPVMGSGIRAVLDVSALLIPAAEVLGLCPVRVAVQLHRLSDSRPWREWRLLHARDVITGGTP